MQGLNGRLVTGGGRLQESTEPQEASSEKRSSPPLQGGGGVLPYTGYRYVPLSRVWFSSSLLRDRVYKSESLGLEQGIIFQEPD